LQESMLSLGKFVRTAEKSISLSSFSSKTSSYSNLRKFSSSKIDKDSYAVNPAETATPGAPTSSVTGLEDTSTNNTWRTADNTAADKINNTNEVDQTIYIVKPPNAETHNDIAYVTDKDFIDRVEDTRSEREIMKDLKRKIGNSPPFMGLWILAGALGFAGAASYYLNETDQYERQVDPVLRMIGSNDRETRRRGLAALETSSNLSTRLFSRLVDIPQPKSVLVERGVVSSLLAALNDEDKQIKQTSLTWLLSFADNAQARKEISRGMGGIINTLSTSPIGSPLWITASSLLLKLSRSNDSKTYLESNQFAETLGYMYKSGHPLATLVSGNIAKSLVNTPNGAQVIQQSGIPLDEIPVLSTRHCIAALNSAINTVSIRDYSSVNPIFSNETLLHLNWALLFSVFGSLYGRARWTMRAYMQGLKGEQLWKFVKKRSKTGRYVFLLLGMDLASQAVLSIPPEGVQVPYTDAVIKVPREIEGVPLTTAVPIAEAALFTTVALFAIRYQRYVVLPVALASTIAHWDTIQKYTKTYQEDLGVDHLFNFELPSYMKFTNRETYRK